MKEFIVREADSLKNFTDNTYPQGSFFFNSLIKKKDIRVNGVKTGENVKLNVGDKVTYYTTPAQESTIAFYCVYRDENVIVVDKESGVNSEAVYATISKGEGYYFIHRLDRNTRGLMIFARNVLAAETLLVAFREKRVEKIYHAICLGKFDKESEVLTAYLKKNSVRATVEISSDSVHGVKIVTEYRVLKYENGLSYVEIKLHTGKTHQIRAHMAYIKHPILGDEKYGDKAANKRYNATRQRLIAKRMRFYLQGELSYLNEREFFSRFDFSDFSEK